MTSLHECGVTQLGCALPASYSSVLLRDLRDLRDSLRHMQLCIHGATRKFETFNLQFFCGQKFIPPSPSFPRNIMFRVVREKFQNYKVDNRSNIGCMKNLSATITDFFCIINRPSYAVAIFRVKQFKPLIII